MRHEAICGRDHPALSLMFEEGGAAMYCARRRDSRAVRDFIGDHSNKESGRSREAKQTANASRWQYHSEDDWCQEAACTCTL